MSPDTPTTSWQAPASRDARGVPPAAGEVAYRDFHGHVGRTFAGSQSWWPGRPTAPTRAPNVVVILCDDLGYSDIGPFGSEIPTPELDRLADEGLRYSNFHVTPMCSPTRAALLTGRNAHAAGVGYVAHADPGFPGYAMELAEDVTTMAEELRSSGYTTLMVGKWHLCKDSDITATGSRASWPLARGFDHFYGFMDGLTDLFTPHQIYRDNSNVTPDEYPDDYYFTDDLTDEAVSMMLSAKASEPDKPFFLYFAHAAVHAPLHARAADMAEHRGRFAAGWDAIRQARFAKQQELGLFGEQVRLSERETAAGDDVPAWDSLDADRQRMFSTYMEAYAGMVTSVDRSLGQVRQALEALGEWDNTLVLFLSDNGASREGEANGTTQYFDMLGRYHGGSAETSSLERDLAAIHLVGGPRSLPHYPRGWAMASNTPFRLYKINTHAGGHTVPAILSWPRVLQPVAGEIRHQYTHATDVLPTLLHAIGADPLGTRHGRRVRPIAGTSFVDSWLEARAGEHHTSQHYEMQGHRGYYRDGWSIVTRHRPRTRFDDSEWELYDLRDDPTETRNLAAEHPELVRELAAEWESAAWCNQVFPMDEGTGLKRNLRPQREEVFAWPVRLLPGTPTLDRYRSLMLIYRRCYRIDVEFTMAEGVTGVLLAHGSQAGGYTVSVEDGRVRYTHNSAGVQHELDLGTAPSGLVSVSLEVTAHQGGSVVDVAGSVNGQPCGELSQVPMTVGMGIFQGIDVGIDRGSPVSWRRHDRFGTAPFSGHIHHVSYTPGEHAPGASVAALAEMRRAGLAFE